MTIVDLITAACRTKGVPEKYAERIQKTFKIEKAEGIETFVDLFKENILPAIGEAEQTAKKEAETAAISAYETKHKLKDGKPVEEPAPTPPAGEEQPKGLSPEVKALLDSMQKKIDDLSKNVTTTLTASANEAKKGKASQLVKEAELPDAWLTRIDLASETSLEDQVKALKEEYTGIQQKAIDAAVASGQYAPGTVQLPERSEADWTKLMNADGAAPDAANYGVVSLGVE